MTLNELIQRALDIASKGLDTSVTRLAMEVAVEPLLPVVFAQVSANVARDEKQRTQLRRTKSLAFVDGLVTIPDDVLTEYMVDASLVDPTDRTKRYSRAPWRQLVTDELDLRLGHFAVEGETNMRLVEPGTVYDPTTGPTITLNLTVPCSVVVPAAATDQVVAMNEILDDLTVALANALRPAMTNAR